jgi:uncharacterized protein (TIGR03437 family)
MKPLIFAALSTCAFAQFASLSTPKDGSTLYFSTPLKEKNTAEPTWGKIFRLDETGLYLLYSREITDREKACSNAFDLSNVSVSSEGGLVAAIGQCSCLNGNIFDQYNCVKIDHFTTTLVSGGQARDYPGQFWLSRNGRLALNRRGANAFSPSAVVIDLGTGKILTTYGNGGIGSPFVLSESTTATNGRVIADNGTAVLINGAAGIGVFNDGTIGPAGGELMVLAGAAIQQIPRPAIEITFADATIDAAGQTILFTERNSITNRRSLRIATPGSPTTGLFVADGYLPALTDDGRQVLYLSARTGVPQAYLTGVDGSGDRRVTNEPEGVAQAIVSGDGTVAYAVTAAARVLKISLNSGNIRELLPQTPHLDLMFPNNPYAWPGLAPGKRVILAGGGFPASTRVSIQGRAAHILSILPAAIDLLVPAGIPAAGAVHVRLQADSPSPFDPRFDGTLIAYDSAPQTATTIHEDWSAVVSADRPARAGEILHTYAFGLGPTIPAVPFGQATSTPAPLATPLSCTDRTPPLASTGPPVEVIFAGLTPGMIALYQVDWRIPATAAGDHFTVSCDQGPYVSVPLTSPVTPP